MPLLQDPQQACAGTLPVRVNDAVALSVALAAGCVEADELLEFLLEGQVRSAALAQRARLRLVDAQFQAIFASAPIVLCRREAPLQRVAALFARPEAAALLRAVEQALVVTLLEAEPKARWERAPAVRLAAVLGVVRADDPTHACLEAVLGGLVAADKRKVEDLKAEIEDDGLDILLVAEAVRVLVACVLG